jgi:hypothetical protein
MSDLKTKKTEASAEEFIDALKDKQQQKDCLYLLKMMKKITKAKPQLWSHGAIGFGSYTYKGASGRTGEWYITGFSPRKQNISIVLMAGFEHNKDLLKKLGKHKTGMGCLYINSLKDIDKKVLEQLMVSNLKKFEEIRKDKGKKD